MNSRALPLLLVVAIVIVVSIGAWLLQRRSGSQCELACAAGCARDLECGGSAIDCATVCKDQCKNVADRGYDTDQCLQRIRSLDCQQAARLALGDTTMLSGSCGVQ